VLGLGVDDEFEVSDGRSNTTNDDVFFAFGGFVVELRGVIYLALEFVNAWHFGVSARADGWNDTVETSVGNVIDNSATTAVLIGFFDFGGEVGFLVKTVAFPECGDLLYGFLAIGVASAPLDGGRGSGRLWSGFGDRWCC
jgi:hypothetical protein